VPCGFCKLALPKQMHGDEVALVTAVIEDFFLGLGVVCKNTVE
jgi:hypothetical protein